MHGTVRARYGFALTGAALLALPGLAVADTLEGAIDDEGRQWYILKADGESTANFSEHMPGMLGINIQGHAEDHFVVEGSIAVSITMMDGKPIGGPEVSYFPDAGMFPMYTSTGDGEWHLETVEVDGDTATVTGTYSGQLALVESMQDEADTENTVAVDLRFDVTALRTD